MAWGIEVVFYKEGEVRMDDRYEYDEEIIKKQNKIIDRLKTINIDEFLLDKLIQLFRRQCCPNPHLDNKKWSQDYTEYHLHYLNKDVNFILGLYEELSKDMFIYMMFSKDGIFDE